MVGHSAWAEWKVDGELNAFYTSDVSLFSASQRLNPLEDPTQPVIDTVRQGSDSVTEPVLTLRRSLEPSWGKMELAVKGQGFVFAQHSQFNHGTFGASVTQELSKDSLVRVRYHYSPNLFLGINKAGNGQLQKEQVTTHFGAIDIERKILEQLMVRMAGRYGQRLYNESFTRRNTRFWTVGTHIEWEIIPEVELLLGYHYERGTANGGIAGEAFEDISAFVHYAVAELEIHVTRQTTLALAFDFEQTHYLTKSPDDERMNGLENIYQGEISLRQAVRDNLDLTVTYQSGRRKSSFEDRAGVINTAWVGGVFRF